MENITKIFPFDGMVQPWNYGAGSQLRKNKRGQTQDIQFYKTKTRQNLIYYVWRLLSLLFWWSTSWQEWQGIRFWEQEWVNIQYRICYMVKHLWNGTPSVPDSVKIWIVVYLTLSCLGWSGTLARCQESVVYEINRGCEQRRVLTIQNISPFFFYSCFYLYGFADIWFGVFERFQA